MFLMCVGTINEGRGELKEGAGIQTVTQMEPKTGGWCLTTINYTFCQTVLSLP